VRDDGVERALDHGDWARACFFFFRLPLLLAWDAELAWVAFDLDTIKLLMQLFVRVLEPSVVTLADGACRVIRIPIEEEPSGSNRCVRSIFFCIDVAQGMTRTPLCSFRGFGGTSR
jgi:hypothetical protein